MALATFGVLPILVSGTPNIVLLHELVPEGPTLGFVGEGDVHPFVVMANAAIKHTINHFLIGVVEIVIFIAKLAKNR